jgi:hypothetical protein
MGHPKSWFEIEDVNVTLTACGRCNRVHGFWPRYSQCHNFSSANYTSALIGRFVELLTCGGLNLQGSIDLAEKRKNEILYALKHLGHHSRSSVPSRMIADRPANT